MMNTQSIYELLQELPLFKNLTNDELKPIVDISKVRHYRVGTHIFLQGEELKNVYFIHKGKVKIYKTDLHGKEQIVNILKPGDIFPHAGFFRKDHYPAHSEMIEDGILIFIPLFSFEPFLIQNPEICIKLFRLLGNEIVDLQVRLEEQILHNTFEQIMMLLLRIANSHGTWKNEHLVELNTNFTNQELANMIGSSRETVSRTLTQLKKKEIIHSGTSGNLFINIEQLEQELQSIS
ncbi:Crp/Fnr family transcriptional regulator [Virgibacillus sp. MSP4-1]|uniref:Crp/Fnr family transcriptional regulator n=1 Tax=Virgibacillus sp. MSP4-1 TaxID=2700081 RepID=UPI0003A9D74A